MRLVCPQAMTGGQARALALCLVQSGIALAKEEAIQAIVAQLSSIEAGARVIDRGFPVPNAGAVDLLATDARAHPVVIAVDELLDPAALCRSLLCADGVAAHLEVIRHAFSEEGLCGEVRIWHFAGRVAPEAESLLRRLQRAPEIFCYQALVLNGERWLVVQRLGKENVCSHAPALVRSPARQASIAFQSILTKEEIDGFFQQTAGRAAAAEDEVTSRVRLSS